MTAKPPTTKTLPVDPTQFFRQRAAHARGDGRVAQQQRALKKLPRMQSQAQHEMTVEQRVGLAEEVEDFGSGEHGEEP